MSIIGKRVRVYDGAMPIRPFSISATKDQNYYKSLNPHREGVRFGSPADMHEQKFEKIVKDQQDYYNSMNPHKNGVCKGLNLLEGSGVMSN